MGGIIMIYQYDTFYLTLLLVIFTIEIIAVIVLGLFLIWYAFKKGFELNNGGRVTFRELPVLFKMILCVPLIIIIVFSVGLSRQEISVISYILEMTAEEAPTIEGEVILVSCEESWYRNDFMGYNVVISVDGNEYHYANSFPADVVEVFRQGEKCRIVHGYNGSDLTAWSVECVDSND